jgi:hypothetical protein
VEVHSSSYRCIEHKEVTCKAEETSEISKANITKGKAINSSRFTLAMQSIISVA